MIKEKSTLLEDLTICQVYEINKISIIIITK